MKRSTHIEIHPPINPRTRPKTYALRWAPLAFALGLGPSCLPLTPKATTHPPKASRANFCELEPGQDRLVFMPYGRYTGSWDYGSGALELKEDQRFFLSYTNERNGIETQWNGRFEWKKQGIGETLNLCDVRKATQAGVEPGTSTSSGAVFNFDKQNHSFEVSLAEVGKIHFERKE